MYQLLCVVHRSRAVNATRNKYEIRSWCKKIPCSILRWATERNMLHNTIAFNESNFLASMRLVTALCVCIGCIVCVCDCIMVILEHYMQIMQHMHTHKAVTGRVEATNLLSGRRQRDYRGYLDLM